MTLLYGLFEIRERGGEGRPKGGYSSKRTHTVDALRMFELTAGFLHMPVAADIPVKLRTDSGPTFV